MSTTQPDQLLLAGQAAAPAGPVDLNVMYLMHHAFRRDLRRFAAAVPATPADDVATWAALHARWEWFGGVLPSRAGTARPSCCTSSRGSSRSCRHRCWAG